MNILWHEPSRSWALRAEGSQDRDLIKHLPMKRWDVVLGVWFVPEIAWKDLAGWPWPADVRQRHFGRYLRPVEGPSRGVAGDVLTRLSGRTGEFRPLAFQPAGVAWLMEGRRCLGDDMGLGKTAQALWAYALLRTEGKARGLVVLCTASKVRDWREDFERFTGRKPFENELHVLNYEKTYRGKWSKPVLDAMTLSPHVLCIDEVHNLSQEKSQRWQAAEEFAKLAPYVWGLSGTPIRNKPESFLPVYRLITGAQVERRDFVRRFCHSSDGVRIEGYRKNIGELHPIWAQFGFRRLKREVTDLPAPRLIPVSVQLTGRQRDLYNEMRLSMVATLKSMTDREFKVRAREMLPHMTRLLQLASHPGMLGDRIHEDELAKFHVLDNLVAEAGDQKVLIWDVHPGVLERIAARYPGHAPAILHGQKTPGANEREKARFMKDPACRMACVSVLAFGEGHNLQAGSVAIFHGLAWNYEKFIQALARIDRLGQDRRCSMYFLLATGTLEEYVFETLQRKHDLQGKILGKHEEWAFEWTDAMDRNSLLQALKRAA